MPFVAAAAAAAAVAATSHIIEYKPLHLSALSIKMAKLQIKKAHADTPTPFQNQLRPGKRIERKLRSNIQREAAIEGERDRNRERERKRSSLSVANGNARHYHGSLKFRRAFKWRWAEMTTKKKKKKQNIAAAAEERKTERGERIESSSNIKDSSCCYDSHQSPPNANHSPLP